MERRYISLSELLSGIRGMVEEAFPERFWVKAEIRQYSPSAAGHCYMTLAESRGGKSVAEIHSVIWRSKFPTIAGTFRQATGEELRAGITVLVKVSIHFSELYGMSLYIEDIDPAFTLGELALERKKAIERLTREGYMEMQKELCIPPIPYNLAVISSPTAAGFQDFINHLQDNEFGYAFNPVLFDAAVQGDGASASIVGAFARISAAEEASGRTFDAVLILRGGGSDSDLACFDDYDMAVAIATCPSPVVTAIGHDKDYHIADMVAHSYVKTPTALADLFIGAYMAEDERISALEERVEDGARDIIRRSSEALERLYGRLVRALSNKCHAQEVRLPELSGRISRALLGKAGAQQQRLEMVSGRIQRGLLGKGNALGKALDAHVQRIRFAATAKQSLEWSHVALAEARIAGADPREILSRGYVLVTGRDNRVLKSSSRVRVGDRIGVRFADGHLRATVNEVARDEEPGRKVSTA